MCLNVTDFKCQSETVKQWINNTCKEMVCKKCCWEANKENNKKHKKLPFFFFIFNEGTSVNN